MEHGVESEDVIYPGEGHGVRTFPAVIDHLTRTLDFIDIHLGPPTLTRSKPGKRMEVSCAAVSSTADCGGH